MTHERQVEAIAYGLLTGGMGREGLTVVNPVPLTVRDANGHEWMLEVRAMPLGRADG